MKQLLSQLGLTEAESFKSKALKMVVWSSILFGAIATVLLWASVDVYMAMIPIIVSTLIIFMAGSKLHGGETDEMVNDDRILTYASVRRSKGDPFGCGLEPFTTMDNLTLSQTVNFCKSQRCKSFYWESNDNEPVSLNREESCGTDKTGPCCPSFCTDNDFSMCEESKCCAPKFRKVVEKQGRFKRVTCLKCVEKKGKAYLYDEDFSAERPNCIEGFHQPDKISKDDLLCLSNIKTWAGFAKPAKTDVELQGKELANKAMMYGGITAVSVYTLDIILKMVFKNRVN